MQFSSIVGWWCGSVVRM